MPTTDYRQILEQLNDGHAVLFLGAGSTRSCRKPDGKRGVTGDELASDILRELNGGVDPGIKGVSLMQASEFYTSVKDSARAGLDKFVQERLNDLRPTVGHYLSTAFPWQAVVTTNYNRVVEDAWSEAHASSYAANELLPIRTDADITQHQGDTKRMRLYKPHGCLTIQRQMSNRMVLTSLDYFESERIRKNIYDAIRSLTRSCSTVFVGYSLTDYTFRNIFYTLYQELGQWACRSYSVGPITDSTYEKWLRESMQENYKTRVVNESFDTFMVRLTIARGFVNPALKRKVLSMWDEMEQDSLDPARGLDLMRGLTRTDFESLPEK
jgi:hypothetical protein